MYSTVKYEYCMSSDQKIFWSITTMATSKFRGLNVFIQDIRAAQNNADAERKRIDKEMANIRQKFTSSKGLDSYNRKKYVWKVGWMTERQGPRSGFRNRPRTERRTCTRNAQPRGGHPSTSGRVA